MTVKGEIRYGSGNISHLNNDIILCLTAFSPTIMLANVHYVYLEKMFFGGGFITYCPTLI